MTCEAVVEVNDKTNIQIPFSGSDARTILPIWGIFIICLMLKIRTKEERAHINQMLYRRSIRGVIELNDDSIYLDDCISFNDMAAIVDYLRSSQSDGNKNGPKKVQDDGK